MLRVLSTRLRAGKNNFALTQSLLVGRKGQLTLQTVDIMLYRDSPMTFA